MTETGDQTGQAAQNNEGQSLPGVTTRSQTRRTNQNIQGSNPTNSDGEQQDDGSQKRNKHKDKIFKGPVEKMHGHAFLLPEESRKANHFSLTLIALEHYATGEYESPGELTPLFQDPISKPSITEPSDNPPLQADSKTPVGKDTRKYIEWKSECDKYRGRVKLLNSNLKKLFSVIVLQCSESVKPKLEAKAGYAQAKVTNDCHWLLSALKDICHKFEANKHRYTGLMRAKANIFNCKQAHWQSVTNYFEVFKELISVLESYKGKLHDPWQAAPSADTNKISKLADDDAREMYMKDRESAALFIMNADSQRFEQLKTNLWNNFARRRDDYPVNLEDAYQLLLTYKNRANIDGHRGQNNDGRGHGRGRGDGRGEGRGEGRGNSQGDGRGNAGQTSGNNESREATRTNEGRTGCSYTQHSFTVTQQEVHTDNHFLDSIPDHYVLLDSDSTVLIFRNPNMLKNIRKAEHPLHLEANGGGIQITDKIGTLEGFGDVWYNPKSIANILSLAQVRRVCRVMMDTGASAAFYVYRSDGECTVFHKHESDLYLHDASTGNVNSPSSPVIAYSYLQTVADNKKKFTNRQVDLADQARKLYGMLGRPSMDHFLLILKENQIINCPITYEDAMRAEAIYGKDVAFVKGKTTASPAKEHAPDYQITPLPKEILELHPQVTLCADIFYVLGLVFSLTKSRGIQYISCQAIADRTKSSILPAIKRDIKAYEQRGFKVSEIQADSKYITLREALPAQHVTIFYVRLMTTSPRQRE